MFSRTIHSILTLFVISYFSATAAGQCALPYSQDFEGRPCESSVAVLGCWTSDSPPQPSGTHYWYITNRPCVSPGATSNFLLRGHPFSAYGQDWATLHLALPSGTSHLTVSFDYLLQPNERVEIAISSDNVTWLDVTSEFGIVPRFSSEVVWPASADLGPRLSQAGVTTDLYLRFMAWNPTGSGEWHWFAMDNLRATRGETCYANCDGSTGSPLLTGHDIHCFISKYHAGDPYADCDGNGILNALDIQCFIRRYHQGCEP